MSRTSGHKWVNRFKARGYDGLEQESRRPKSAPLATAEDVVMAVIEARDAHPRWGPRKLEVLLRRRFGEKTPSARTIARILKRAKKVRERRRERVRPARQRSAEHARLHRGHHAPQRVGARDAAGQREHLAKLQLALLAEVPDVVPAGRRYQPLRAAVKSMPASKDTNVEPSIET